MSVNSVQQQQYQDLQDQQKRAQEKHEQARLKAIDDLAEVHQENIELQRKEDYKHGLYSNSGNEITDYQHVDASNDPN